MSLYQETKGQAIVRKEQSRVLDEQDKANEKMRGKASNFNAMVKDAKVKLKAQQESQRQLMGEIKQKHLEILKLEDRQKSIQDSVKAQKDKGYSPRSSKQAIQAEQKRNENALSRLAKEVNQLDTHKT